MTKILVDSELLEIAASAMKYVYDDLVFRAKLAEDDSLNIGQGALDSLLDAKSKLHAVLSAPQQEAVATVLDYGDGIEVEWAANGRSRTWHGAKLYTHPAPSVPEVFDRSKLKRLVTQVFGEGYQIVPPSVKGEKE